MCGIFGFIAKNGSGPDLDRLRRIATITQRRGHHAFGLAWLDATGTIRTIKRPGPAVANLGDLVACLGTTAMIGHCRWATHGTPDDNRNNHPHPAGRGWLVHNGVVHNYASLIRRFHLPARTDCDSEVLGLLLARFPGPLTARAVQMAKVAEGPLALLGLWSKPDRLLIVRRGNPLYCSEDTKGIYFASQPDELPGNVFAIADQYAGVLVYDAGNLYHEGRCMGR